MLLIKSIHIGNVLEEVCELFARFDRIVGGYIVGKLGNLERNIFFCKVIRYKLQECFMGFRTCSDS